MPSRNIGRFNVFLYGFPDPLFHSKNGQPIFTISHIFLTERRLTDDFEWMSAQFRLSVKRRLKDQSRIDDMHMLGFCSDGDAAHKGLSLLPFVGNAKQVQFISIG